MYTHYDRMGQVAREHQREMLAEARRHQLRRELWHQPDRPAPRTPYAVAVARRLGAVIAKAAGAAARVPQASRPRPQPLGETPASR
jgi:hypothetical protein